MCATALHPSFSIILIFFSPLADVLHEEVILRWYKDTQEGKAKGKTVFLEQMTAFIDWLKNAEEEGECVTRKMDEY